MLNYVTGNYPINDHCWLDESNLVAASGNLIKFYKFDGFKWINTRNIKPVNNTILKIKCYNNHLIATTLDLLCIISLIDYKQYIYNFDFWILNFEKINNLIIAGHSDLSVSLLKFPELELIKSFPGNFLSLATSLAICNSDDYVSLGFTNINTIREFRLVSGKDLKEFRCITNPHRGLVYNSKFIFDGKYLATASEDLSVIIYNTSLTVITVLEHKSKVWDCISIDNLIATCASDGNIYFWNLDGNLLNIFSTRAPIPITNLSFYGNFISGGSQDGNLPIKALNNDIERTEYVLEDESDWVRSVTVYNDSLYILTNKGQVFTSQDDILTRMDVPDYFYFSENFEATAFSIALDFIFIGDLKGQIHVFPISDFINKKNSYKVLKCFEHRVGNVLLKSDSFLVATDNLGNAALIDYNILSSTDKHIFIDSYKLPYMKRYGKITSGVVYASLIALGDEFGNIYYGDIKNMKRIAAHSSKVTSLLFYSSSVYSCGADGFICQWTMDFELVRKIKVEHMDHLYYMYIDSHIHVLGFKGTKAIYYNVDHKLELWTVECGGPRRPTFFSVCDGVFKFIFSTNTQIISNTIGSKGYSLNPWLPYDDLYSGLWTDNGLLVGGKDGFIRCININISTYNIPFSTHVRCISFIDGMIVVGGIGLIKFYDNNFLEIMKLAIKEEGDLSSIRVNFIRKINKFLICGLSNSSLHFYLFEDNLKPPTFFRKYLLDYTPLVALSLSSSLYIGTSKGFVTIINIDKIEANNIKIHSNGINGITSVDNYIITCGDDQKIILSRVTDFCKVNEVYTYNSVRCISSYKKYVFSAGWDLLLSVWHVGEDKLIPLSNINLLFKPRAIIIDYKTPEDSPLKLAILGSKGCFDIYTFYI